MVAAIRPAPAALAVAGVLAGGCYDFHLAGPEDPSPVVAPRVVSVKISPQPFVRVLPLKYPTSEIYSFKPLNERVPVYQKPFTLVQVVILEGQPAAQAALRGKESLTLTGTLDYQACDDTICFNPASVPLSWTVALRPLVTGRPNLQ